MGEIIFITGPTRSGKSRRAVEIAQAWGDDVVFVATYRSDSNDAEMVERVGLHRAEAIDENALADRLRNDEVLAAVTADKMQETASRMQMLPGSGFPQLLVSVGDHREVIRSEDLYSGAEAVVRANASVAVRAASKS